MIIKFNTLKEFNALKAKYSKSSKLLNSII